MFLPSAAVKVVNTIFVPPATKRVEAASGGRVDDRAPQAAWPCTWVWRSPLLSVCTPRSVVRLSPAMRRASNFPRKEDLVYSRMESFEEELLNAIREREPGESVLAAFARFVRFPRGLLATPDPPAREQLAALTRMIEEPCATAREQQIFAAYTEPLAALVAEETGADSGDIEPWVTANAIMGVHQALIACTCRRIVDGARPARLAREVQAQADRALARLGRGLDGYAVKRPAQGG
jgi:hypothetical protein